MQPRVIPSTTSHKKEPLLPTLEVFAKLGLCELDLNLGHMFEGGLSVETVRRALDAGGQRVWFASGGWCDFFYRAPQIEETFTSVARQVDLSQQLGVSRLRLFYGRLKRADYSPAQLKTIAGNLTRLSDTYPEMLFVFENHDGASLRPEICREILEAVNRSNIRMNFDPINFERGGANSFEALDVLRPFIAHVHLKGVENGECCEFGDGDVDLLPVLRSLIGGGYRGDFTVEYEGIFDRTIRLYRSTGRAREVVAALEAGVVVP